MRTIPLWPTRGISVLDSPHPNFGGACAQGPRVPVPEGGRDFDRPPGEPA
jgi:hypothetical protein